jgi:hypothetical protein
LEIGLHRVKIASDRLKIVSGHQFGHDEVPSRLGVRFRLLLRDAGVAQTLGVPEGIHSVDHECAPLKISEENKR